MTGKPSLIASWKTSAVVTGVVLALGVVWLSSALAGGNPRAWFGFAVALLLVAGRWARPLSVSGSSAAIGPRPDRAAVPAPAAPTSPPGS